MITRREKLLIRPWEQKRYENHRRKVQSALPAIDDRPPPDRIHVTSKLKKQQKENERCDKIEQDNLKLLQRLRRIMKTNRIDNTWSIAQPSFLNRVEIYAPKQKSKFFSRSTPVTPDIEKKSRKEKCSACTPQKMDEPVIPEERVPWEPPKRPVSRKRSQSVPLPVKSTALTLIKQASKEDSVPKSEESTKPSTPQKLTPLRPRTDSGQRRSRPRSKQKQLEPTQSIVLSRGDLHLSVNFPIDTLVKLKEGKTEKFIIRGHCQCKAIKAL